MSGLEFDPDGTNSFHAEHPWEQVGHPLYIYPDQRTRSNWPPEAAYPHGPHEASQWDALPEKIPEGPKWRKLYGVSNPVYMKSTHVPKIADGSFCSCGLFYPH